MKNRLIWCSIFLITVSWLFLLPFYSPPRYIYSSITLLIGFFFSVLAFLQVNGASDKTKTVHTKRFNVIVKAFYFIFSLIIYQSLIFFIYIYFASNTHDVHFFIYPAYWLLNFFGYDCSLGGNVLNVSNTQLVVPFTANVEKLSILPSSLLLAAAIVCFYYSKIKNKTYTIISSFFLIFLFVIFRFVLLITLFLEYEDIYQEFPPNILLFIDPWITIVYLALITLVLSNLYKVNLKSFCKKSYIQSRQKISCLLLGAGIFLCCGAFLFQDPGNIKNGKILIDDVHSKRWEKSTVTMGKYDFGGEIVYSYSSMVYWLRHYFQVSINSDKLLDQLNLDNYSILILKTPAFRYSKKEIQSIINFVENGGGLFLIGDHSNLLGMTTFLNQIAKKFGFSFNYDSSNQFSTNFFTQYSSIFPFSHPTVMGLDSFTFLTSCTMKVPLLCERSMIGFDAFSDTIDYSKPSFFGDIVVKPNNDFGLFLLGASKKIKKGRITLFTDSTVFSNFCLFLDGHDRYFLNSLNFLNRENKWGYNINWLLCITGILIIGIAIILSLKKISDVVFLFPAILFLFIILGCFFWGGLNHYFYKKPEPEIPMVKVAFLDKHTEYYIPPGLGTPIFPFDTSFETFYLTPQRIGLFPYYTKNLDEATENADAIVIINPVEHFTNSEKIKLSEYVKNGGNLLVMDTIHNRKPHLRQLAEVFNIKTKRTMKQIQFSNCQKLSFDINNKKEPLNIQMEACYKKMDLGVVVIMADSKIVSRASISGVLDDQTDLTKKIFTFVYDLFEKKFHLKPTMIYP